MLHCSMDIHDKKTDDLIMKLIEVMHESGLDTFRQFLAASWIKDAADQNLAQSIATGKIKYNLNP